MEDRATVRQIAMVWLVGGIALVAMLSIFIGRTAREQGWDEYVRLMRQGAKGEATVVRLVPGKDCRAEYSFSVAGRSYSGTGSRCNVKVGQKVAVTYLVADPARSCLGRAGERLADEVVSFFFGGFSFPSLS